MYNKNLVPIYIFIYIKSIHMKTYLYMFTKANMHINKNTERGLPYGGCCCFNFSFVGIDGLGNRATKHARIVL